MPCPALPALIVHTPRRRAAGDSSATALAAPRTLYELVGCRFSSLRRMSGLFGPSLRRKSGVRTTFPAMRRRASCMSSRVILLTAASVAGIGGFHLRLFDRRDPRAEGRERDALADTAAFEARGARQECPAARSFEPRRARAEGDALLLPRHVERHHDRRAARRDPRVSEHARIWLIQHHGAAVAQRRVAAAERSEERRVGKECRSGWCAQHYKKKHGEYLVAVGVDREMA